MPLPEPRAMGTTPPKATASEVALPSMSDADADAPVAATVWPLGPSRRMLGPVSSVPIIDATPERWVRQLMMTWVRMGRGSGSACDGGVAAALRRAPSTKLSCEDLRNRKAPYARFDR